MIKGSTIIYNDSYIDELTRHYNNVKEQFDLEDIPDIKEKLKTKMTFFSNKLDEAIEFQDTIDEIMNLEVPSLSIIKTISGRVIPLANVKVLDE